MFIASKAEDIHPLKMKMVFEKIAHRKLPIEKIKSMEIKGTIIEFQKRVDFGVLKNGYEVIVYPRNKRSKILFYYHPELNHLGWKEVSIILVNKLPVLNGYEIKLVQK